MDLLHHGMALAAFDTDVQEKKISPSLDRSHSTAYFVQTANSEESRIQLNRNIREALLSIFQSALQQTERIVSK
jgi:hypothetical protein